MSSLFKRKNSPYWYISWYDKQAGRAGSPVSTRTPNRREALLVLKEFDTKLKEQQRNNSTKLKPLTLSEARDFFKAKKTDLSEKGMDLYILSVEHLIKAVGDIYLMDFDHQSRFKLMEFFEGRKIADSTKNIYLNHLKSFFNFFIKNEMLEKNYIRLVREQKKEIEIIPQSDVDKILGTLEGERYFLIQFLLLTGLRVGEALALSPSKINLDTMLFKYTNFKAKKEALKPIIKPLYDLLIKFDVKNREELFHYNNFWGVASFWRRLMEDLGMKYNLHQLRKTCGSYLANIGVDIFFVSHYLGHSSVKVTEEFYTFAMKEKIRKEIDVKILIDDKAKKAAKKKENKAKSKTKNSVINSAEKTKKPKTSKEPKKKA